MACGFLYNNLAAGLTAAGTSPVTGLGFDRFNDAQPRARVRFAASAANFQFDLGSDQSWDCAGLISTTLGAADSARLRAISSNSCPWSQDFSHWTQSNVTLTTGQSDPLGGANATKLVEDGTNSQHLVSQTTLPVSEFIPSQDYTYSAHLKAAERSFVLVHCLDTAGAIHYQMFNLGTGALGTSVSGSPMNPFITSVGGGWYRCGFTFNVAAGASPAHISIWVRNADNTANYAGTVGSGILAFGVQLDLGDTLQPYVPTGATAGLLYDSGVLTGVTDSKWLGNVIGVLPSAVSARYVRWDVTGTNPIDMGVAPVGRLFRPGRNFSFGAQEGYTDYAIRSINPDTGSHFAVSGPVARSRVISFPAIAKTEARGDWDAMDRTVGAGGDILFIEDVADSWLDRAQKSIWGSYRAAGASDLIARAAYNVFSRTVRMTERL